jgi:hypothetical protein
VPAPVRIGIEIAGLKELARDVRAADPVLAKGLKAALLQGAQLVADEYKQRIRRFSTRIPPTIRPGASGTGAYVRAGGIDAPHAAALENFGKTGFFRHPVFGNSDLWVDQQAHPAALPALEARADDVVELADKALADWAEAAGFE